MRANLIKTNFTAGEVSPRLMGRVDIARYANGAKIIENAVVVAGWRCPQTWQPICGGHEIRQ